MNHPDQLTFTKGGGVVATLFGLAFSCGGVLVFLSPWIGSGQGSPIPRFVFGGVFALLGVAMSFGRAGAVLDRARGELTTWWGILVPFSRKVRRLEGFTRVAIRREFASSGSGQGKAFFPIFLRGEEGQVDVHDVSTSQRALEVAQEIAGFIDLSVIDATKSG